MYNEGGLTHGWTKESIEEKYGEYKGEGWFPNEHIDILDGIVAQQESQWEHESGFQRYLAREKEYRGIREMDKTVKNMSLYDEVLTKFLARYGLEGSARKIGRDVFAIEVSEDAKRMLDKLPEDFVYIGGAARAVLERSLGVDAYATPRDIDIAVMSRNQKSRELIDEMSKKYMPEDYSHGHGIGRETSAYFETRDFTINEVFATSEALYCTRQCLFDTLRGIIRFSECEKGVSHSGDNYSSVHPKLLAKALRLAVLRNKKLSKEDESEYTFQGIDMFHMSLHFGRALEQGVGEEYTQALRERKQIPEHIKSMEQLIDYIEEETCFVFRSVPKEKALQEDAWWSEIEKEYQDFPMHESMGRRKKSE